MTNKFEVPAEMRDMADKSVKQARQAFTGFISAIQKSSENVENLTGSAGDTFKDATSKATSIAESNVNAAFDLAEKLVNAKDPQEFMKLQADYVKQQMESAQKQAKEMGETFKKMAAPK